LKLNPRTSAEQESRTMFTLRTAVLALLGIAGGAAVVAAQPPALPTPRPSPNASVSQTVGITEITVHYSRPGVKGRQIWGKLVPYGEVWRTGANENTTIQFSTPVRIDGHELPAGTYGLQTIPTAQDWTFILSKDADRWGAFTYDPKHDALRATVHPAPAAEQEWMSFDFTDLSDNAAVLELRWEKIRVPVRIEVDTTKQVVGAAKSVIRWQTPMNAASYCLQAGACLDEAAHWIDASIAIEATFANQRAKAQLLAKRNDYKDAVAMAEKALATGKASPNPPPAAQLSDLESQIAQWKSK
jgi:hypothetical protein